MSIHTIATACLAAAIFCAPTTLPARTLPEIQQSGTILLATDASYAPFNFMHAGQPTGYEVEVAEAVVTKMGLKWEWKTPNFEAILPGLAQNYWDVVIASHAITQERANIVSFTQPHYCSGGQIVSLSPHITQIADLKGMVVAAQAPSTYLDASQKIPEVKEVKSFPTDKKAFDALINHRVNAWVTDRFIAKKMQVEGSMLGLHVGQFLFVEKIAAAVAKNNHGLREEWNLRLQDLLADGTIAKISRKYFKEDITCK